MSLPHLHIAIPAMDELETLPSTLKCIASQQTRYQYTVYICVNQPESYWQNPEKACICAHNQELLAKLRAFKPFPITILDYSSQGHGWSQKNCGVGWARKKIFEQIFFNADAEDIIISMDADTEFGEHYFESIGNNFHRHPRWHAIAVPYYHPLTHDETINRAMLRYEIYMRNYALNMIAIGSPYSFTALGSAIAVRAKSLQKIGGITPFQSGEDFYLMQKLRKMGAVGLWNDTLVSPGTRFSNRVLFGTGPAMKRGADGDWSSYPIYHHSLFQKIANAYEKIDELYQHDLNSPFLSFLQCQFNRQDLWQPLRRNAKNPPQFHRAFHEKADGLRILQFLKQESQREKHSDFQSLHDNIIFLLSKERQQILLPFFNSCPDNDLMTLPTAALTKIREFLFEEEMHQRKRLT